MPAADRPVVVNSTPIIALAGIGRLDLLRCLAPEVLVPPAVWEELESGGERPGGQADLAAAPWIKVATLEESAGAVLLADLGRGEAEVIALARQVGARLVVIDDRLGRRHAARLGLPVTGTIGVLVLAKERRLVTEVLPLMRRLEENGLYLSQRLKSWVRARSGEE